MYATEKKAPAMDNHGPAIANQQGSVIVAALMILVITTIIGIAAINTSTTERQTSTNFMLYERAFYCAEAGMEHVKEALRNALRDSGRMPLSGKADWTFALNNPSSATDTKYEGGVEWIADKQLNDNLYSYTITIWDNDDGDSNPAADADGLIWVRSEATGPGNARSAIETILDANAVTNPITDYGSQEGGGSGKTYTSNDANNMDFTAPALQVQING